MRYRITTWPLLDGHWVTMTGIADDDAATPTILWRGTIPYADLKVDDPLHLLEAIWREVGAVTP
ncbi:MAG TPA: hypothetical protein VJQ57_15830 [Acidimicrobiia bacterium]|nr:hypothetical protein [Acidimicrobiia bacterium]